MIQGRATRVRPIYRSVIVTKTAYAITDADRSSTLEPLPTARAAVAIINVGLHDNNANVTVQHDVI